MDQSWRPRPPPIQGNNTICPTCSVYHFPFCPPPLHPNPYPFHENPRFQPLNENYMQRPRFDPFIDHRRPPPNLQRPLAGDPNDGFTGRRDWHTSPNLENRIPYGQSQTGEYDYRDGFEMNNHGGVGIKRMRVDELGSSMLLGSRNIYANSSRNGYQGHERILKLIHDHGNGNAPGGLPRGGDNYETNRYVQGRSEEFQGFRDDYFDTNRGSFHADHYNVDSVKFREERGALFGENVRASDSSDRFAQSRYDPVEDSMPLSLQYGGHGSYLPSCFANTVETKQREDDSARYYEGSISYDSVSHNNELTQRSPMSQNVHYATSETRTENYHSFRGLPPSDNISVKELHYSRSINNQLPSGQAQQSQLPPTGDCYLSSLPTDPREPVNVPPQVDLQDSVGRQNSSPFSWPNLREERRYPSIPISNNVSPRHTSHLHNVQPPLPSSPPPPLPKDPGHNYVERLVIPPQPQPPKTSSSLFPIALSSRDDVPTLHTQDPRAHSLAQTYNANKHSVHASTGFAAEDFRAHQSSRKYLDEGQPFRRKHPPLEKLHIVDATHIFKHPHRTTRPDRIVIILRGLPGSGKSYLAKMLRDLEVENGGTAPRIHSMDEYFMTEVEKVEESEVSKSSSSVRGKRSVMKTVMEYCYEPEMEEAYRSSMLKAFKKTLDEGDFSFVIVDDRNLRVADFAQFWAIAKRSGYEVYLLEAAYKDPAGCAARNVHGFTQDNIQEMARQWEEAPSLYLKLDIKSLLHGDDLEESGIKEVDMDMEDGDPVDGLQGSEFENAENAAVPPVEDFSSHGLLTDERKGHKQGSHLTEEVKELKSSKWSDDLDDDQAHGAEGRHGHSSALSGLIQAYSREGKSVRWSDQGGNIGFSIGAAKRANVLSLVIGPGSGYNLKSNPLPAGENLKSAHDGVKSKSQNIFQQRMRAEHESFKAVFDKRRQRIGGFGVEEE